MRAARQNSTDDCPPKDFEVSEFNQHSQLSVMALITDQQKYNFQYQIFESQHYLIVFRYNFFSQILD